MGRRKFVGGNWKMNGSSKQVQEFSSLFKVSTFNADAVGNAIG
jgi:triosephosphate isomerase